MKTEKQKILDTIIAIKGDGNGNKNLEEATKLTNEIVTSKTATLMREQEDEQYRTYYNLKALKENFDNDETRAELLTKLSEMTKEEINESNFASMASNLVEHEDIDSVLDIFEKCEDDEEKEEKEEKEDKDDDKEEKEDKEDKSDDDDEDEEDED